MPASEIAIPDWPLLAWARIIEDAEARFRGEHWIDFVREHAEIPIFAVSLYLGVVFYVPPMIKGRKNSGLYTKILRILFTIWNLLLAIFSIIGATRTVPHLYNIINTRGFYYSICTDPKEWYLDGSVGFWVGLFIFSKIPELLDTVFLVLQQKKVIFLHWFHHCTVMLYCWHAYHNRVAPGLWFAAMNFAVHSIMYTYYFAMAARLNWLAVPFAPLITTTQILQMAIGRRDLLTPCDSHSLTVSGSRTILILLLALSPATTPISRDVARPRNRAMPIARPSGSVPNRCRPISFGQPLLTGCV